MTTDSAHAHVQCDTCNEVTALDIPVPFGYTALDASTVYLVGAGWEVSTPEDRDIPRHRCPSCIRLRKTLADAALVRPRGPMRPPVDMS